MARIRTRPDARHLLGQWTLSRPPLVSPAPPPIGGLLHGIRGSRETPDAPGRFRLSVIRPPLSRSHDPDGGSMKEPTPRRASAPRARWVRPRPRALFGSGQGPRHPRPQSRIGAFRCSFQPPRVDENRTILPAVLGPGGTAPPGPCPFPDLGLQDTGPVPVLYDLWTARTPR